MVVIFFQNSLITIFFFFFFFQVESSDHFITPYWHTKHSEHEGSCSTEVARKLEAANCDCRREAAMTGFGRLIGRALWYSSQQQRLLRPCVEQSLRLLHASSSSSAVTASYRDCQIASFSSNLASLRFSPFGGSSLLFK